MSGAKSAGVLLYRHRPGDVEVLLAHPGGPFFEKRDAGAWTVPKGEPEAGEALIDCALRELGEELGPAAPALSGGGLLALGSIRQKGGKVVHAWAAEADFDPTALSSNEFELEWPPRSGRSAAFPEVDRVAWFTPREARQRIKAAQAELIDRLLEKL